MTEWIPSPENINGLPEPIRQYIHDLETRCDPAGDLRARIIAEDSVAALTTEVRRLRIELGEWVGTGPFVPRAEYERGMKQAHAEERERCIGIVKSTLWSMDAEMVTERIRALKDQEP